MRFTPVIDCDGNLYNGMQQAAPTQQPLRGYRHSRLGWSHGQTTGRGSTTPFSLPSGPMVYPLTLALE